MTLKLVRASLRHTSCRYSCLASVFHTLLMPFTCLCHITWNICMNARSVSGLSPQAEHQISTVCHVNCTLCLCASHCSSCCIDQKIWAKPLWYAFYQNIHPSKDISPVPAVQSNYRGYNCRLTTLLAGWWLWKTALKQPRVWRRCILLSGAMSLCLSTWWWQSSPST